MGLNENKKINHRKLFLLKIMAMATYFKLIGNDSRMVNKLGEGFLQLGGVYVKFLQGVLLQIPIMRSWKNDKRFDVYENVPVDNIDSRNFIAKHLNQFQQAQIIYIADKPFASGSFGQVYKGKLLSGEIVAVKLLRPNTRKILKSDLRLLKIVTRFLAGLMTSWDIDINSLVKEFSKSTLAETDYNTEIKHAENLYRYFHGNKTIVIPKTYKDISNKNIIVQDYIEGFSLAQLLRRKDINNVEYSEIVYQETGSDLSIQIRDLGVELNKAILKSAPVHGDPHPGNIRLLPNNKVALLDFGVQTKPIKNPNSYYSILKEFWRAEYLNQPRPGKMFVSYIHFYANKLYDSIKLVSEYASKKASKEINLDEWIAQFSDKIFKDKVSPEMLLKGLDNIRKGDGAGDISVDKIVNPGNRFSIGVKTENGLVLRAIANYFSLVMELGYRSMIPNIYNEVVNFVEQNMPHLSSEAPSTVKLNEAIETVYLWLEKIGKKDRDLYYQIVNYINPAGY